LSRKPDKSILDIFWIKDKDLKTTPKVATEAIKTLSQPKSKSAKQSVSRDLIQRAPRREPPFSPGSPEAVPS